MDGIRNPYRAAVSKDIVDAILKVRANGEGTPSQYWSQGEQETRLQAAFDKWSAKGGVWSAAAASVRSFHSNRRLYGFSRAIQVHATQMGHIKKGCLSRNRQDISTDGSRIENLHKGWNYLQRTHASGLETFLALGHDFVLRRNIRIGYSHQDRTPFLASTHSSHHVRLVNYVASVWNSIINTGKIPTATQRPVLPEIDSGETFGLVESDAAVTFDGLFTIKAEDDDLALDLVEHVTVDDLDARHVLLDMHIDPALLEHPQTQPSASSTVNILPHIGGVQLEVRRKLFIIYAARSLTVLM